MLLKLRCGGVAGGGEGGGGGLRRWRRWGMARPHPCANQYADLVLYLVNACHSKPEKQMSKNHLLTNGRLDSPTPVMLLDRDFLFIITS